MDNVELADVLAEISAVVLVEGYPDRAEWLAEREASLRAADPRQIAEVREELRGVVHGMGGLIDIHIADAAEQRRFSGLIDKLWNTVRP